MLPLADVATNGPSGLATYGPILAAVASFIAVAISALTRKDKQRADAVAAQDTSAQTAIKGLTEAYDRMHAERNEEAGRADKAELRVHALENENESQYLEIRDLQRQLRECQRTTEDAPPPKKRTPMKKTTRGRRT